MRVTLDFHFPISCDCFFRSGAGHQTCEGVAADYLQHFDIQQLGHIDFLARAKNAIADADANGTAEQDLDNRRGVNDDHDVRARTEARRLATHLLRQEVNASNAPAAPPSSAARPSFALRAASSRRATCPPPPLSLSTYDAERRAHFESESSCPCAKHTFMCGTCQSGTCQRDDPHPFRGDDCSACPPATAAAQSSEGEGTQASGQGHAAR